ncbi:MAG: RusA family crossover junction endodeoxyribonuclease [Beijerinckiaceae bacterium]
MTQTLLSFDMPYPPSTNKYWRHISRGKLAGRTLISEEGRNYRAAVAALALKLRLPQLGGSVRLGVSLSVHAPDRRRRDLDNTLKAAFDSLTHAGLWADDSQIDQITVSRGYVDRAGGFLRLTVTPMGTIPSIQ